MSLCSVVMPILMTYLHAMFQSVLERRKREMDSEGRMEGRANVGVVLPLRLQRGGTGLFATLQQINK